MPRFIPLSPETQKALEKLHADPVAHGMPVTTVKPTKKNRFKTIIKKVKNLIVKK